MKEIDFSPEIWKQLENTLTKIKSRPGPYVAAFDADGTLWNTDVGENFFQYQIENKLVPLPKNPWDFYLKLKKKNNDPREAYLWLAQINAGVPIEILQDWATRAIDCLSPLPIFKAQQRLISILKQEQVSIYIVTASIKWAVDAAAPLIGLGADNVLGIETEISPQNLITSQQKGPITYLNGKVESLLDATNQKAPFLASGNTMGDLPLLESATLVRLAVSAVSQEHKLYSTEMELQRTSQERGWLYHRFS